MVKKVTVDLDEENMQEPHEVLSTAFDFSKKDNLLALHTILKNLGINSISDLEVRISRAE